MADILGFNKLFKKRTDMTLIEAVRTGLPLRRKPWAVRSPNFWYSPHPKAMFTLTKDDILATDWEVNEEGLPPAA